MSDAEGSKSGPGPFAILWFVALVAVVGGVIWAQSRSTETTNTPEAVAASPDSAPTSALANGPTLAACQAAARWAALANPGAQDPSERAAWADLQAEMVTVTSPATVDAYNDMVQAFNQGTTDVAAAIAEQQAAVGGTSSRNQQALQDYSEEYLRQIESGNYDSPPLPTQEEYQTPDLSGVVEAKGAAAGAIQEALGRFTADCRQ